jgi:hypothetical protein
MSGKHSHPKAKPPKPAESIEAAEPAKSVEPKSPEPAKEPEPKPEPDQDQKPAPEPQLRWTSIPHDGAGELSAAVLPGGLGCVLRLKGEGLCFLPGADLNDGQLTRHAEQTAIAAAQVKEAQEHAPRPGPAEIARSIRAKEEEFFLQNQRVFEAKATPVDPSAVSSNASPESRSPLASPLMPARPAEPAKPATDSADPRVFGSGQFRIG